jgi:predicted Rossmann fold nucleotide-binding protein DprA/Smf involved in DNA uptake
MTGVLPDEAYAAALTTLPGCGPARVAAVAAAVPSFREAWHAIGRGGALLPADAPGASRLAAAWRSAARRVDVEALWRELEACGVRVLLRGADGYPHALLGDPEPPVVLFATGALATPAVRRVVDGTTPCVAIVGTRRCTGYGADVARSFGRGLAAAGVTVVSGLAAGIDAAAHDGALVSRYAASRDGALASRSAASREGALASRSAASCDGALASRDAPSPEGALASRSAASCDGALARRSAASCDAPSREGALASGEAPAAAESRVSRHGSPAPPPADGAPPVGVVGSGLDVVYPRRNRRLWRAVASTGLLLSEAPLGAAPEPWRFPLRNRIIAALADVVVVVESHASGGSMHTVRAALDRDVPVMAVPGSVRSPSSAGTNRLIAEGLPPAVDVDDVLVALSLKSRPAPATAGTAAEAPRESHPRPQLDPVAAAVLDALDWAPTTTEDVLRRTCITLGPAAAALNRLEMAGLARSRAGTWERTANHE